MAERGEYAPTVTISIDEYFDLRNKAEMNAFLMKEISDSRIGMERLWDRVFELERKLKGGAER